MVDLRGKARYQRCLSGFKLATSKFVSSILDVYHYSDIPQALRFDYTTYGLPVSKQKQNGYVGVGLGCIDSLV